MTNFHPILTYSLNIAKYPPILSIVIIYHDLHQNTSILSSFQFFKLTTIKITIIINIIIIMDMIAFS